MKKIQKNTLSFLFAFSVFITFSPDLQAADRCYPSTQYLATQAEAAQACPGVCSAYGGWNGNFACSSNGNPPAEQTCQNQYPGSDYGCVCGCNQ